MQEQSPKHLEHFSDDDVADSAPPRLGAHAACGPDEQTEQAGPDTDVELAEDGSAEPAEGNEIDGLSSAD
jgi:hypothetical protein